MREREEEPSFRVDEKHSIWAHDGCFNLLDNEGQILMRLPIENFTRKPAAGFRSVLEKLSDSSDAVGG